MSKRTPKITKIHTTLLLFYVDTIRKFESNKRQWISFLSPKEGRSLSKTIMLVVRSSGLWEAYTQTCQKWDKNFTTACWCRSMIACQVSWILDDFGFIRIWKTGISMFADEWRCQGVWHSFPFLAWDLSMHRRTRIWFFNQVICSRACACSSHLNYAHKMPRKPS